MLKLFNKDNLDVHAIVSYLCVSSLNKGPGRLGINILNSFVYVPDLDTLTHF